MRAIVAFAGWFLIAGGAACRRDVQQATPEQNASAGEQADPGAPSATPMAAPPEPPPPPAPTTTKPPPSNLALFTGEPPQTFRDLEAALDLRFDTSAIKGSLYGRFIAPASPGPPLSADVTRLGLFYEYDPYHGSPPAAMDDLYHRGLVDYTVYFARGRAAREAQLRARHGAPRGARRPSESDRDPRSGTLYRVYGPFFVVMGDEDAFELSWYRRTPDWAVPAPDAAARERYVRRLASALDTETTRDGLVRAAPIPANAGVKAEKWISADSLWLEFAPPMPAADLARALGLRGATTKAFGTHKSTRQIVVPSEGDGGSGVRVPSRGGWRIDASIDAVLPFPFEEPPESGPIGPTDVVRQVGILWGIR